MILNRQDIPKRQSQCSEGAHSFQPGDKCYTLVSLHSQEWQRRDLCEGCWQALQERGMPEGIKSYWTINIPSKAAAEMLPKHKEERALVLLKRALASQEPLNERESFVLALFLARRKFLFLRQEIEQLGETIYLYETADTEELLPVKKVTLHPHDIDILQNRLAGLLTPS